MANQDEKARLSQQFLDAVPIDVSPPKVEELVLVKFDDGSVEVVKAEEVQKNV